ncbi:MAG: helix-turn-helix transcriptional regulator [Sphingomonas sp.]|nr:helix-turn-helix transcriptional regulator [Sphingomonas sp.]
MKTENLERLLCLLDVRLQAIGLCEVAPGWRLSLPCAEGVLVHYILQGSGVLCSGDGGFVPFQPDTLIFLHPNCGSHELAMTGAEPHVAVWKNASAPLGEGMMRFTAGDDPSIVSACAVVTADCGGLDLFEQLREPICEQVRDHPGLRQAFNLMLAEFKHPRFGTRALAEALMKQSLVIALRQQVERGDVRLISLPAMRDTRLLKALLEMMEQPARGHTLDQLARTSGMSRSLFAERFAETFERPPMDLLKQIRLHRAANLLRSTQLPIQIIAMTVGYASRSYFSRAFRAAYDRDPKAFREEARTRSPGVAATQESSNAKH